MDFKNDGQIDFTNYSIEELLASKNRINQEEFPKNYQACLNEIEKRKNFSTTENLISGARAKASLTWALFIGSITSIVLIFILLLSPSLPLLGITCFTLIATYATYAQDTLMFREVYISHAGLRACSLIGQQNEVINFSDIDSIGLCGGNLIQVRTLKKYSFGKVFYFYLKDYMGPYRLQEKNPEELVEFFNYLLSHNPNIKRVDVSYPPFF